MTFFQEYSRKRQIKALIRGAIELLYTEQFDFAEGLRKLSPKNEGMDFLADLMSIQLAAQLSQPPSKEHIDRVLQALHAVETQDLSAAELKVLLQQRRESAEQAWNERREYIQKGKNASKKDKYSYEGTIYAMENARKGPLSDVERDKWKAWKVDFDDAGRNYNEHLNKKKEFEADMKELRDLKFAMGLAHYIGGMSNPQEFVDAVNCFKESAESGHGEAQYYLGSMYEEGLGVQQNIDEALKWWRNGATQGNTQSQNSLGSAYQNGTGVRQDYSEAMKFYRMAAEQGHSSAQHNLGLMYDDGLGVRQDSYEAVKWWLKAASQGNSGSQNNLGVSYQSGTGVKQNFQESIKWYSAAAEQGLIDAQYNLAVLYSTCDEIKKDMVEAVKWFRKAAEQGHARSQLMLGLYYGLGRGVETDADESRKWIKLAADQGDEEAIKALNGL